MWTFGYKGFWIHGYCDRATCRVQAPSGLQCGEFRSLRAAKRYIGQVAA